MMILRAASFAALFLFWPFVLAAETVTLSAKDGALIMEGRVLGYDGRYFRLDTVYGEVTIDGRETLCAGLGCPTPTSTKINLRISGAPSATSVLLPALVEGFALRNGYAFARVNQDATHFNYTLVDGANGASLIEIGFRISSSAEGFVDLIVDEADLVASLRPIRAQEATLEEEAGRGDLTQPGQVTILALDALVPVVSPQSDLTTITLGDLAAAFADPEDGQTVHTLARNSGVYELFVDRLLTPENLTPSDRIVFHDSVGALANAVLDDPKALGLTVLSGRTGLRQLSMTTDCTMTYETDLKDLKSGDYPLVAPIYLYRPARRLPPIMQDFFAYLETPAAQVVVQRAGFVNQQPDLVPISVQGTRLMAAIAQAGSEVPLTELKSVMAKIAGYERLSVTLRFTGDDLTPRSQTALARLETRISQGAYANDALLLTGHTARPGPFATNQAASTALAQIIRDRLPPDQSIEVFGAGDAIPAGCEQTALGRSLNRRVEVWVK